MELGVPCPALGPSVPTALHCWHSSCRWEGFRFPSIFPSISIESKQYIPYFIEQLQLLSYFSSMIQGFSIIYCKHLQDMTNFMTNLEVLEVEILVVFLQICRPLEGFGQQSEWVTWKKKEKRCEWYSRRRM